jgi:serine/threonine protein kinase
MGRVYRGRHRSLEKDVAIKVTLPGAPVARFLREARLLARIKSPHVVQVYDFEILPNDCPMLVMEWVEGTDLARVIKDQGMPLAEAQVLPWMEQICKGMLAATEEGIIHRDVKPSNILIDEQGRALIVDFGLARELAVFGDLSRSGEVMGTPYYMAPEQAEDPRGVDFRADIYSFGAAFYHALTGEPPFRGDTWFTILYKHKTEPVISPRARNPHLSAPTSQLLERCLAKSPQERFQSFAEILRHLQLSQTTQFPWDAYDDTELAVHLKRYQPRWNTYLAGRLDRSETDTYEFPGGRVLRISRGNIADLEVEAIVSSDNDHFTIPTGTGGVLRLAAGEEVYEEVAKFAPVRPGRVAVTSAGALSARFIFHAVILGRDRDGGAVLPTPDLIAEVLASCFYHADSLNVRSIAFPLLGTGPAGFSRAMCLDTMLRFLTRMLLRGLTPVQEVRMVLFS